MNLQKHYDRMWDEASGKFKTKQFETDPMIDSSDDDRYGITLLARPSEQVKQNISEMLNEIKSVAPLQYYYPLSDLHFTVLSVISCYSGFSLTDIQSSRYINLIELVTTSFSPFRIRFQGITASPSCIIVQGFPEDDSLNELRTKLREQFRTSDLQNSIDHRYLLKTAHLTCVRFREVPENPEKVFSSVSQFRNRDFGISKIDRLELVGNDWYQRKEKTTLLDTFHLTSSA
ncbi:2'-5' RNA ligase family protein [Rhodohalobacter sp. 614A]|uniref:2'-5' RNA ligase family protein n=1 Tax=Rhodohalobacter sp. 614A TaxID=2908649 RepID=UPI001F45EE48|nr:hypothetical protein [Rhodohalobacter sp. 614A]